VLLWEEDIPRQTGSDLTGYGVSPERTPGRPPPFHASHFRTFTPFRAELREQQEPAEGPKTRG
jgi:hypothetical protein